MAKNWGRDVNKHEKGWISKDSIEQKEDPGPESEPELKEVSEETEEKQNGGKGMGEDPKDVHVRDWSDQEIEDYFVKKGIPISGMPKYLWGILILVWFAVMLFAAHSSNPGLVLADITAMVIILVLGYWQANYPEQVIIECMGKFYKRKKAGWGFILLGFMKIRNRVEIGKTYIVDVRTDETSPIALKDDDINISAVAGVIPYNIIQVTYGVEVSKAFKEKKPGVSDWQLAADEAIDTGYRTMLGGKSLEGVIDETSDVKNKLKEFKKDSKFIIKSQLNQDVEKLADSTVANFGINISYLNTKEIILSDATKKKRREMQDLAVDIKKQDLQTTLELKKISTRMRVRGQDKVDGDAAGLKLGSTIKKAADTAEVEPKQIIDLMALGKLSEANTTIFTTADKDGGINLPAIGAMFGAGSEAGKDKKKKTEKPGIEEKK